MEENVDVPDKELYHHVRIVLKSALQGDMDKYYELVRIMRCRDEPALMVTCLEALSVSVSCLNIYRHQELVSSILGMSMWNCRTIVMHALIEFVISLATCNTGQFLVPCLQMLVSNFTPPRTLLSLLNQPRRKDHVIDRVHAAILEIVKLVPLSLLKLEEIIVKDLMPRNNIHKNEPVELIVTYVENMLKLESGPIGDIIVRTMLVTIMDRLRDLDVDITWDDILHEEYFTKGIFDMELEGPIYEDGDVSWMEGYFGGNLIAEELDRLMVLTFEHLKFYKYNGCLTQVFDTLLLSFKQTVFKTYKSKFAQFVMFYACSLDPENCGKRFADTLFDIFIKSRSNECTEWNRMSAIAYLASYLARAKFLPISSVAEYVERLVEWCSDYCSNYQTQSGGINAKAHQEFYAGCQAMLYVLCFRMRSVVAIPHISSRILKHIDVILRHPLRPLMVCLPSIVEEFLRLAKVAHLDVPDNFEVSSGGLFESQLSMAFGGAEKLDMFFPFDPCLLMRCDTYIRPIFVYWSMVQSSYVDDDDEDTSDDDIEISVAGKGINIIADSEAAQSYDGHDLDEFNYKMSNMSITPKVFGGELRSDIEMPSRIMPWPESL